MKQLKSTGVFYLVIRTDWDDIKNIFGYAGYVYALIKMNLWL
jgi:hypothetical protein